MKSHQLIHKNLKNGLEYIYVPNSDILTFSLIVAFKVGSRDESEGYIGSSHLLEHMLFKGTTKRPEQKQISEELDRLGSDYNATTSKNITNYYIKAPKDNFEKCLDILCDMVFNSVVRSKDLEKEKKVVIEEYNKMLDNPSATCIEQTIGEVFKGHPLEKSTIGTKESILGFNRDKVYEYYKKYYNPNNCIITICGNIGNISQKNLNSLLDKYTKSCAKNTNTNAKTNCYNITSTYRNPVQKITLEKQTVPRLKIIHRPNAQQCAITIGFPCMDVYSHDEIYILKVYGFILGGGLSSRLFREIREKAGLAYTVAADSEHFQDTGAFLLSTAIEKNSLFENQTDNKEKEGGLYIILHTLEDLLKHGVKPDEVETAKTSIKNKISVVYENTHAMAAYYNEQLLLKYPKIINIEDFLKKLESVTAKQINELIKKYLTLDKFTLGIVGNYTQEQVLNYLTTRFAPN